MKIKFSVQASQLNSAIDTVKAVAPQPLNKERNTGFLFLIKNGGEGYVYSVDKYHCARARMDVFDVEGEGLFMYPAESIGAFKYFSGPIAFQTDKDADHFSVTYDPGRGAGGTKPSFDPKWMQTFDKELKSAQDAGRFSSAVLREALAMSKDFHGLDNERADDHHKTIQMFDASYECDDPKNPGQKIRPYEKGDGVLYAANGSQAYYFESEAFKGKNFALNAQHLSLLLTFLGKVTGPLIVKTTDTKMFVMNEDESRVFGWAKSTKHHAKHSYYGLGGDKFVFKIGKDEILDALGYMREEMREGTQEKDKVRLIWNEADKTLQFEAAEGVAKGMRSMIVPVQPVQISEPGRALSAFVNIKQLQSLFKDVKGATAQLRVYPIEVSEKRPKGGAYLRTLDTFCLDANGKVVGDVPDGGKVPEGTVSCTVTRFMPSYE